MSDLLPKQLFTESHDCIGSLFLEDCRVDDLNILIHYPLTKQGVISGKVIGNQQTFYQLGMLMDRYRGTLSLLSKTESPIVREISSNEVAVRRVENRHSYDQTQYVVAELEFQHLDIRRCYPDRKSFSRTLTFFLTCPGIWQKLDNREYRFENENSLFSEIVYLPIEFNEHFPFLTRVCPVEFTDEGLPPEKYRISTQLYTIKFETNETQENLSQADFISQAKDLVDDLCLLVSFLSKGWTAWTRYESLSGGCFQTHLRHTREGLIEHSHEHDDMLVNHGRELSFLKTSLTGLRAQRSENIDLFLPLITYVSGVEARFVEEKFTILFLCLEKLKDMYAKRSGMTKILKENGFEKLESSMRTLIQNNCKDPEAQKLIVDKLPELNRPTFQFVLESMLKDYDISWKDLYPVNSKLTLISTRNRLFHSSERMGAWTLIKDMQRVCALVERILLSQLGWRDFSQSPAQHLKRNLTHPVDD